LPSKVAADPTARTQAERLVGQGDRQFADGKHRIARLYFARAAGSWLCPAAIKLADTFDAEVLPAMVCMACNQIRRSPKWRRRAAELAQ